ncbi:ATP-binding protein [Hyphomicrobium sp. 2TAF46]|uniref:ATP-binding protein n=1 Tax=Hyphomicrobium sp. 2TAF46 TaxID=3233019 RepID=UPI003F927CE4
MRSATRLNRQLAVWMAAVTGVALAVMIAGMVLFYSLVEKIDPMFWNKDWTSYWPQPLEWAAFCVFWLLGVAGAIAAAVSFTRGLIRPLEAVGAAARHIARGDLTARAAPEGAMFDETRQLVDNFNRMATQLAAYESEMRTWNSAIAHELRTPLTILRGRLQGLYDDVFAPDKTMVLNLIQHVDGLTRIVEDLRTLSLAEAGRLELLLGTVNLASEAQAVLAMVGPDLTAAGISTEVDLPDVVVRADCARIRQALLALIDNVVRYASDGHWMRVETRASGSEGVIRVSDRGPGLPAGFGVRAFDAFTRADESRSRAGGGTGLGLAVVQAIARSHGGTARSLPAIDRGAVFEIAIPRQLH